MCYSFFNLLVQSHHCGRFILNFSYGTSGFPFVLSWETFVFAVGVPKSFADDLEVWAILLCGAILEPTAVLSFPVAHHKSLGRKPKHPWIAVVHHHAYRDLYHYHSSYLCISYWRMHHRNWKFNFQLMVIVMRRNTTSFFIEVLYARVLFYYWSHSLLSRYSIFWSKIYTKLV